MTEHKFYQQAYRAYAGTSFVPEKRAASSCQWYDEVCAELTASGKESAIEKFTALYLKSLAAKARCYSPMISGPANFPVARMEKYNRWERSASDALLTFLEKVRRPPREPRTELDYGITAKDYTIGSVRVLHNTEQNRLQLFFPGKPEREMIDRLKGRGFKWSPRNSAWQRQLTPNALRAIPSIFPDAARPQ